MAHGAHLDDVQALSAPSDRYQCLPCYAVVAFHTTSESLRGRAVRVNWWVLVW